MVKIQTDQTASMSSLIQIYTVCPDMHVVVVMEPKP